MNESERGTCEVLTMRAMSAGLPSQCGEQARYRYPAAGGGYMRLCAQHGLRHDRTKGTEVWTAEGWKRATC